MNITAEWLKEHRACADGVEWLFANTGIGADATDVLRDLRAAKQWSYYRWLAPRIMTLAQRVEWAAFCVEQVLDTYESKHPNDKRPRNAIDEAKKWISASGVDNRTTAEAAYAAANAAATEAAESAYASAYAAAGASYVAGAYAYAARVEMSARCAEKAEEIIARTLS